MVKSNKYIEGLIEDLSSESRRLRQNAALELNYCCVDSASIVLPESQALIDALDVPETRTRWAVLEAFSKLVAQDASLCEPALASVENALFDETSGPLHLSSMRFLCNAGRQNPQTSDLVWPLIDEAIQCFHGDQEFPDMLTLLVDFSMGNLSDETKKGFSERMMFDAQNNRGYVQRKAQLIVDNLSK